MKTFDQINLQLQVKMLNSNPQGWSTGTFNNVSNQETTSIKITCDFPSVGGQFKYCKKTITSPYLAIYTAPKWVLLVSQCVGSGLFLARLP